MTNYDDIENLAITIGTLQGDIRRDPAHKFHQSWLSLIKQYRTQFNNLTDTELIVPLVIESISDRSACHEKLRINLIKSLSEILQADDIETI